MADLSNITSALQSRYEQALKPQPAAGGASYAGLTGAQAASYDAQLAALKNAYDNSLAQSEQKLAAIPQGYDPQRQEAALTRQKAESALPEAVLNSGYSADSGLARTMGNGLAANYCKAMNTVGAAQGSAVQSQQNDIQTLGVNYQNSLNKLLARLAAAASK